MAVLVKVFVKYVAISVLLRETPTKSTPASRIVQHCELFVKGLGNKKSKRGALAFGFATFCVFCRYGTRSSRFCVVRWAS